MKQKILLFCVMMIFVTAVNAQKEQSLKGYAITAAQKGQSGWKQVRLVDVISGAEVQSIYKDDSQVEILNARTKKPVVKKDINPNPDQKMARVEIEKKLMATKAYTVEADNKLQPTNVNVTTVTDVHVNTVTNTNGEKRYVVVKRIGYSKHVQTDKPFATNSAACAYDKKHERLYYTPMGISQLRYIDLKSNKIYYFEDEKFGVVAGSGDVSNHITRMVFGADGDGYALTNNGDHLIRFTTGKKPVITDLGALSDDAANGKMSIHDKGGYGGDMIADANDNLYLITAGRRVFKIDIETRVATYLGNIKGLPQGFSTNGAMVEGGSKVIVASSESTLGYFRFDLNTLQAEKVSGAESVYNASDLANGVLAFAKEKKKKKTEAIVPVEEKITEVENKPTEESLVQNSISVYPNPVSDGLVNISFNGQPAGRYNVQLVDVNGQVVLTREYNVNSKLQQAPLSLPQTLAKGTYVVKVFNDANRVSVTTKLIVQ